MALNPVAQFPLNVDPASPAYPYGEARNVSAPGSGDGTPWEELIVNDVFGFQQSLLKALVITPNGSPDFVSASQYLQSIVGLASGRANFYADIGIVNVVTLMSPSSFVPTAPAYFNGQIVRFKPLFANTGAVTIQVGSLAIKALRSYRDEVLTGGEIDATVEASAVYVLSDDRFRLLKNAKPANVIVYTTSPGGGYTVSPGTRAIIAEVQGGGGGGGGADGQGGGTGVTTSGGSAGGYCKKLIQVSALTPAMAVNIGVAGAAGAAAGGNGGNGGASSFAGLTANGGVGSIGSSTGHSVVQRSAGEVPGGTATGGDLNIAGGAGQFGITFGTPAAYEGFGGGGGSSQLGRGGGNSESDTVGNAATGYGGGGSGAAAENTAANWAGGAGTQGVVIITEIF